MQRGAYGEAVGLLGEALSCLEAATGPASLPVARLLNDLGVACKFAGQFDRAEEHYRRAIRLIESFDGPDSDAMATLLHNIAGLAHSRRRFADGVGTARHGLAMRERLNGPDDLGVATDAAGLAALLEGVGDNAEAQALYRRATGIFDAAGEIHEAAMARNGLGSTCQALDQLDEAQTHYRAALAQLQQVAGGEHPDVAHVLNNLATLHRQRGNDGEAHALLARAHDLLARTVGPDHPVTIEVAGNRRRVESTLPPHRSTPAGSV